MGGLGISYLPQITVCQPVNGKPGNNGKTTSDLGQAFDRRQVRPCWQAQEPHHARSLGPRPIIPQRPAQTLLDVVHFYENRFGLILSRQGRAGPFQFPQRALSGSEFNCL